MMYLQVFPFYLILLLSCDSSNHLVAADVTNIAVSGKSESYTFNVTISSPDSGCSQYADWWEVVSDSGDLIYRRILRHSHVDEQPFTRSGGSIGISEYQVVWIRAHMNNAGYGGKSLKGSVLNGFTPTEWPDEFAEGLDRMKPLPTDCAF